MFSHYCKSTAGVIVSVPPPVSGPPQVAPTAVATIEKLKEENRLLKEERDFLREQLKSSLDKRQLGKSLFTQKLAQMFCFEV